MAFTGGSRIVDVSRSESDLSINIKKATNVEETAPKRAQSAPSSPSENSVG